MLFESNVLLIILNILFLSIPEELFLVILSLMLSRKFELVTGSKKNIVRMLIPTAVVAVLTNVLRGFAGFDMNFMPFISIASLFASMMLVYKFFKPREMLRCFICIVASFIALGLIQAAFIPAILYGTSITMDDLNKPGLITFIISLPERLIETSIIVLILLKRKSFLRLLPIRIISKSRLLSALSLVLIVINLIYVYVLTKSIYFDRILTGLTAEMQLLVLVAIFGFPIANITAFIATVHAFAVKERKKDRYIYDETRVLRLLINTLIKDEKYNEIDRQLKSFEEMVKVK